MSFASITVSSPSGDGCLEAGMRELGSTTLLGRLVVEPSSATMSDIELAAASSAIAWSTVLSNDVMIARVRALVRENKQTMLEPRQHIMSGRFMLTFNDEPTAF